MWGAALRTQAARAAILAVSAILCLTLGGHVAKATAQHPIWGVYVDSSLAPQLTSGLLREMQQSGVTSVVFGVDVTRNDRSRITRLAGNRLRATGTDVGLGA